MRSLRGASRRTGDGGLSSALTVDPAIESVQLRQHMEALRSWRNFLFSLFPLFAAIAWLILSPEARLTAGLATSLATGFAGIQLDRLLDARREATTSIETSSH